MMDAANAMPHRSRFAHSAPTYTITLITDVEPGQLSIQCLLVDRHHNNINNYVFIIDREREREGLLGGIIHYRASLLPLICKARCHSVGLNRVYCNVHDNICSC